MGDEGHEGLHWRWLPYRVEEWDGRRAKFIPILVQPRQKATDIPPLGSGQVYVTKFGVVYHSSCCSSVDERWVIDPTGVLIVAEETVRDVRRPCRDCDPSGVAAWAANRWRR
jgi:hypothetical protein